MSRRKIAGERLGEEDKCLAVVVSIPRSTGGKGNVTRVFSFRRGVCVCVGGGGLFGKGICGRRRVKLKDCFVNGVVVGKGMDGWLIRVEL